MTEGAENAGLDICIISLPVLKRQEGIARMRAEATEVCATIGLVRQGVNIHTAWGAVSAGGASVFAISRAEGHPCGQHGPVP